MKKYAFLLLLLVFPKVISAQAIELELFKDGFNQPLNLQHARDDRLFIVEKEGKIKILNPDLTVLPTPFLDISNKISTNGERGLLGLAFHPNYQSNGYFYINYTDLNGNTQIARFSVNSSNPNVADDSSETILLSYNQPQSNHNGGDMHFGPDGYLYIASGDGGDYADPLNRAQDLNQLLGKILRIDVDNPSGVNPYGIPPDNPFIDTPNARSEIWASGLRNPWRISFDEEENAIWIADVGQANQEEINRQSLDLAGLNYGWRCYEGNLVFDTQDCPQSSELTFPLYTYPHTNQACSITGGHVYRGTEYPENQGLYFFADYCNGMISALNNQGEIVVSETYNGRWVSFGKDPNDELYIISIDDGKIYRIHGERVIGVEDHKTPTIQITPNPATNQLLISLTDEPIEEIQIFDIQGRLIHSEKSVKAMESQISVSHFKTGVYFVNVTTASGFSLSKKLLIR